jgi:Ca-activated chloride channel homolog
LQVGPYHTNTVAGLELAMDLLRRRKNPNKQIFMITDGKPTCLKENGRYYKNSFGLDSKILNKTMNLAAQCRKLKIPVTTFMIASDPYLKQFVQEFTEVNNGNAYYSSLKGLGDLIFEDYKNNRKKTF